jgi:aspartate kinase
MIVMKFGGASLASPASIKRVASIVLSEVQRVSDARSTHQREMQCNPVVVTSGIGDTTDQLLEILEHASRAESYLAWKLQEEVRTYHFCVAEDLLAVKRLEPIDQYIRQTFRDLHVRMLEVCEGEYKLTPELCDWVVSLGEQLSSRIVAAALQENGLDAMHMDSTKLLLTDEHFTNATPRYWESYARIRWSVPIAARHHVVVLGGFIGATEDGRTTTLGRGGSDLTASIIGAALNADEIQVWKDVDGMLTWDPKLRRGGYRLKSLSYEEADELAQAGATILHPETIAPAQRLRIPVTIRNTFHPEGEGTRIGIHNGVCFNPVKSIACKTNVAVIELRSPTAERTVSEYSPLIERLCREKCATLLALSDESIYLALEENGRDRGVNFALDQCMEVHVRSGQAIITLVGQTLRRCTVVSRVAALLNRTSAVILPQNSESHSVRIMVAQEDLAACLDVLEEAFFADVDAGFFALPEWSPEVQRIERSPKTSISREQQVFATTRNRLAFRGVL